MCNEYGIHVRPSAVIAKEARLYAGSIRVTNSGGLTVEARNLLALISLGLGCGQSVTITVDGAEAERTCDRMVELFQTRFDFARP